MSKKVVIQDQPNPMNPTSTGFIQNDFDQLIWDKGYKVIHEKCIQCPCKSPRVNQLSTCENCGGTGWIFVNPVLTHMVLKNMNENTKFKAWSQENLGKVAISCMNKDRLTFMDKITLTCADADFNEVRYFRMSQDQQLFAYCSYNIKRIDYVGLFIASNQPLQILEPNIDYTFDGNRLFLNKSYNDNYIDDTTYNVTVRYRHLPQFFVVDINRQVMKSQNSLDDKVTDENLPLAAIGQRAHYLLDAQNITKSRLLNNSYDDDECDKQIKTVDSFSDLTCFCK